MKLNHFRHSANCPISGQGKLSFYFTETIGLYSCTRPENDGSKTCKGTYDTEISAEFEYNAQIEVHPSNNYELLPHTIGAKGTIRLNNGNGINS